MKTTYEKLAKNGIDHWIFGKSKKKAFSVLWILLAVIILLGMII